MLSERSRDTGVGTVPPLCAFGQGCVQAESLLLTEAGTAHTSTFDHKVALLSEESSMYMNFIDWMARTSHKKKKKTWTTNRRRWSVSWRRRRVALEEGGGGFCSALGGVIVVEVSVITFNPALGRLALR